jgi:hypothetical protein
MKGLIIHSKTNQSLLPLPNMSQLSIKGEKNDDTKKTYWSLTRPKKLKKKERKKVY